jgi:hypothetical protein
MGCCSIVDPWLASHGTSNIAEQHHWGLWLYWLAIAIDI